MLAQKIRRYALEAPCTRHGGFTILLERRRLEVVEEKFSVDRLRPYDKKLRTPEPLATFKILGDSNVAIFKTRRDLSKDNISILEGIVGRCVL